MATGTYHHGDLRDALLDAVGEIIQEQGVGAVSLREAARRVGVSHSAPAHHFGDKTGLMSAFAARGFDAFGTRMSNAFDAAAPEGAHAQFRAIGVAYLQFSIEECASFEVMFRPEFHDPDDPEVKEASLRAFGVLMNAVKAGMPANVAHLDPLHLALVAWATVHGLATLWHDGLIAQFTDEDLPSIAARAFEIGEWYHE
jgi:AcrR family transcriptional regulator